MNLLEIITGPKEGSVADPRIARIRRHLNNLAIFFLVAVMWIALSIATPNFGTQSNITNVLRGIVLEF